MSKVKVFRDTTLGEIVVAKRRNAQRITLRINKDNRPQISIPHYVPYQAGLAFARNHADWIAQHTRTRLDINVGQSYELGDGTRIQTELATKRQSMRRIGDVLIIKMHAGTDGRKYFDRCIRNHLAEQTKQSIEDRLPFWQQRMGVNPTAIRFRATSSRWGSCSSKGIINFSAYAAQLPDALLDYIIVHELAHLRHMNHSQAFWNVVAEQIDDFKQLRKQLKTYELRPEIKKL